MLELTGKCCSAEQAIEFFESLANIIPEDDRTDEFCDEFEQAFYSVILAIVLHANTWAEHKKTLARE